MRFATPVKLPMWEDFEKVANLAVFGITAGWAVTHRFHARWRLAKSCKGLKFDAMAYSAPVAAGYDALTRCLLAWSVFEMYVKLDSQSRSGLLRRHGADEMVAFIRKALPAEGFYGVVLENLTHHKKEFAKFMERQPCDPYKVLGAFRHVFAHGDLTPSGGGGDQGTAVIVCDTITGFLMDVVERDWKARVKSGLTR